MMLLHAGPARVVVLALCLLAATACAGGGGPTSPSPAPAPTPSPSPAPAPSPTPSTVSLSGTVTSSTGARISGATVTVLDGVNSGRSTTTNASGVYRFDTLQMGNGNLSARASGYGEERKGVHIDGRNALDFTLGLSAPAPYVGTWSGTTSQGKPISFQVSDNAVVNLSVGYTGACGFADGTRSLAPSFVVGFINNSRFSFQTTTNQPTTVVSGTFRSGTSVSGNLTITFSSASGGLSCTSNAFPTWTATKQ